MLFMLEFLCALSLFYFLLTKIGKPLIKKKPEQLEKIISDWAVPWPYSLYYRKYKLKDVIFWISLFALVFINGDIEKMAKEIGLNSTLNLFRVLILLLIVTHFGVIFYEKGYLF